MYYVCVVVLYNLCATTDAQQDGVERITSHRFHHEGQSTVSGAVAKLFTKGDVNIAMC